MGVILATSFCYFFYILVSYDYQWARVAPYAGNLFSGWGVTVLISVIALVCSTLIAVGLTAAELSSVAPAKWLARTYVELVRGTPFLVQILIVVYMIAPALQQKFPDLPLNNKFGLGVLLLSGFAAAYLAEIFRGGIESIAKSQWDSARAIGLRESQIYRWVVVPQAIRRVLPATAGQFANLIKDSSLLFVIGLHEFTMQAREINATTYTPFESYLPLAIGYLALTLPISIWSRRLEKRFRYEH